MGEYTGGCCCRVWLRSAWLLAAAGQTLSAPKVDSVNTFDAPNTVAPKAVSAKVEGGKLTITVAPASVTVLGLE